MNRSRSTVYSLNSGMVATSQPLAVNAGLNILRMGGNAADAAVAVAACLNVLEPASSGIGGDCFCLYFDGKDKSIIGLNGSGRYPSASDPLEYLNKLGFDKTIPMNDANSITVPGAAAGYVDTVEKFGSGKLTLLGILTPAIKLAENGFPVSKVSASLWKNSEKELQNSSNGLEVLKDGNAPNEGDIMKFPLLGRCFSLLAEKGKAGFYEGEVATAIVETIAKNGGRMTLNDLKNHSSTIIHPIKISYLDKSLNECPPNGQGITALIALGIIEQLQETGVIRNLSEMEHNGVEYLHVLIESLRLAFADSFHFVTDPTKMSSKVIEKLLSKEYHLKRSKLFSPLKASTDVHFGAPLYCCDTVYLTVVDKEGNACSFINSVFESFGSKIVAKGTGICLQNRGSNFSLNPHSFNVVEPNKRPYHTIIPAIVTDNISKELFASFGVMGGYQQPQGHLQVLLNLLHFNMTAQESVDALRFNINSIDSALVFPKQSSVSLEEGFKLDVVEGLRKLGHNTSVLSGFERKAFGRGQVIVSTLQENGIVLAGGSDFRGDGYAGCT
ncbi:hypothetical protein HK099_005847 [Clydaea vesicula]|uniref:Gamma-glutamyltranspeptidase n=1 Tax=Clydaea vesicula TaxID=447962 RepID=A0AAD5XUM8_9FUNG|nr:hypothetical protein HK099_005847 [Clydaea vesicula]